MAVNYFTFGGVKSSDYGIYISGEGVFDAPKRAVEMVSVPGRNGALALDQGYYENITVTYPAFNHEGSMSDFRTKLANFRNAIASKIGYQRLTDTFHSDEYRMAMFVDGVEIKPIKYNTASEFEIKFQCKPQRYLTTGETVQTIANSGDTLTNPTQYDSSPLLAVKGYGTIDIAGQQIELDNSPLGDVLLASNKSTATKTGDAQTHTITSTYSIASLNTSDVETLNGVTITMRLDAVDGGGSDAKFTSASITSPSTGTFKFNMTTSGLNSRYLSLTLKSAANATFAAGTASAADTSSFHINWAKSWTGGNSTGGVDGSITFTKTVNGDEETLTVTITLVSMKAHGTGKLSCGTLTGYSTVTLLGNPTYIDCDLGECYKIEGGEYVSLNGKIALGSDLPVLKSGANTITFDNTVTELKVTPRWWKL